MVGIKLRKDKLVVVLETHIYVYNFHNLSIIQGIETCLNPRGLCALNPDTWKAILACPDPEKGHIRLHFLH